VESESENLPVGVKLLGRSNRRENLREGGHGSGENPRIDSRARGYDNYFCRSVENMGCEKEENLTGGGERSTEKK